MKTQSIAWITRTAILISLLIISQIVTVSFGNTLVTGSIVNLILIVSVMLGGLSSGLTVAAISPILAKLIGIGPFWELIPFIVLGNIILVLLWHWIGNRDLGGNKVPYFVALIVGAIAKFLLLSFSIGNYAIPVLLKLPEPQATVVANLFSLPQLFTALIGGIIAITLLPILKNAIYK